MSDEAARSAAKRRDGSERYGRQGRAAAKFGGRPEHPAPPCAMSEGASSAIEVGAYCAGSKGGRFPFRAGAAARVAAFHLACEPEFMIRRPPCRLLVRVWVRTDGPPGGDARKELAT